MPSCHIGLMGLAVMGQNLARNLDRNNVDTAVYNRSPEVTRAFMAGPGVGTGLTPCYSLEEFVAALEPPRRILLMVEAGPAVDSVLTQLAPLLSAGDMVMDGGNSHFLDSNRRLEELAERSIRFLGLGVSGGEQGALLGPSLMPGGDRQGWDMVEPVLTAVAARHKGEPCVAYMGAGGAGHLVKMVHNGIEYGDMQLMAEAYDLMQRGFGLTISDLAQTFADWDQGVTASFLMEITAKILTRKDTDSGRPLVDVILDTAGQKGTGRWTTQTALDLGVAVPTITAAVDARILSAHKKLRQRGAETLSGPISSRPDTGRHPTDLLGQLRQALLTARLCCLAQAFDLLAAAEREYAMGLDLAVVARVWRAGCIIRSALLDPVAQAFDAEPGPDNLLMAPAFSQDLRQGQWALRSSVAAASALGVPCPAMAASLAYLDSLRSARLPANLIQAQRDFFGAHTFERTDRDGMFHEEWQAEAGQD